MEDIFIIRKIFYLFENFQQIIPDYLSKDKSIVADAKYIPLDKERNYGDEKATAIYYKTITYMYRFCSRKAYLFYPHPDNDKVLIDSYRIKTEMEGVNGGELIKVGLKIPAGCKSYSEFASQMLRSESEFLNSI